MRATSSGAVSAIGSPNAAPVVGLTLRSVSAMGVSCPFGRGAVAVWALFYMFFDEPATGVRGLEERSSRAGPRFVTPRCSRAPRSDYSM
ncbi:hypothetical protein GCM10009783_02280 [Glycomyces lechevalierae]